MEQGSVYAETPPTHTQFMNQEIPMRPLRENPPTVQQSGQNSTFYPRPSHSYQTTALGPSLLMANTFQPSAMQSQLTNAQIAPQTTGNPNPTQLQSQPQSQSQSQSQSHPVTIAAPGYVPSCKDNKAKSIWAEHKYAILVSLIIILGLLAGGYYYWKYVMPLKAPINKVDDHASRTINKPSISGGAALISDSDEDDIIGNNIIRRTNRRTRDTKPNQSLRHKNAHTDNKISRPASSSQGEQIKKLHEAIDNLFTKTKQQDVATKALVSQLAQLQEDHNRTVEEIRKHGKAINEQHGYISKIVSKLTKQKASSYGPTSNVTETSSEPESNKATEPVPETVSPERPHSTSQIPLISSNLNPASVENENHVESSNAQTQLVSPLFRAS